MKLNKLTLKNYKQYRTAEINFADGLTGLLGKNGAGKSTIFEAITDCLFGEAKNIRATIKNDKAGDKESVELTLEFTEGNDTYNVSRIWKRKNLNAGAELKKNGTIVATGTNPVTQAIVKFLKIGYRNFLKSFFAAQNELTAITAGATKEREVFLRQLLGFDLLDKIEKAINEKNKEYENDIKAESNLLLTAELLEQLNADISEGEEQLREISGRIAEMDSSVTAAEKNYSGKRKDLATADKTRDEFNKATKSYEVTKTSLKSEKEKKETAAKTLADLLSKKAKADSLQPVSVEFDEVTAHIQSLNKLRSDYARLQTLKKTTDDEKNKLKLLEEELSRTQTALSGYDSLDSLKQEAETKKNSLEEKIKELNDKLNKIGNDAAIQEKEKKTFSDKLKKIKKLGKDAECPECSRTLNEVYDDLVATYNTGLKHIENELATLNAASLPILENRQDCEINLKEIENQLTDFRKKDNERSKLTGKLETDKKNIKDAKKTIDNYLKETAQIGEVNFNEADLPAAEQKKKELEPQYKEYLALTGEVKNIAKTEKLISEAAAGITKYQNNLTELEQQLTALNHNEENYQLLKQEAESLRIKLDEEKDRLSTEKQNRSKHSAELDLKKNRITEDNNRRQKLESKLKDLELKKKAAEFFKTFKNRVTSGELPKISLEATQLFEEITQNKYRNLHINNDYNIMVEREDKVVALDTLSGGEKDLASLCLRVAISNRVATLSGRADKGFLALDEVFGSQDAGRRSTLLNALEQISKKFKQIFIISHNEDVQESFPNVIKLKNEGGHTTVSAG